jgi:hypothetical protein
MELLYLFLSRSHKISRVDADYPIRDLWRVARHGSYANLQNWDEKMMQGKESGQLYRDNGSGE